MFAGLIDVQDRVLYNRSYTTGHKSYRARATVELGRAVGWDDAHDVLYAGALDIAVGPRWYSTYEMACQVRADLPRGRPATAMLARRTERRCCTTGGAARAAAEALLESASAAGPRRPDALSAAAEPARARARSSTRSSSASAQVIMETRRSQRVLDAAALLRVLQHGALVLRHLRASAPAQAAVRGRVLRQPRGPSPEAHRADNHPVKVTPPKGSDALDAARSSSSGWTVRSTASARRGDGLDGGLPATAARTAPPLVQTLALGAAKASATTRTTRRSRICLLEDYGQEPRPTATACCSPAAKHTAGHRKYGSHLDAWRRYADAFGLARS